MRLLFLTLLINVAMAQSTLDDLRWYLNPNGQELLISIDDLHDETIVASSSMNWGRETVSGLVLKKDVLIAVIDGGVQIDHPEFKDFISYNEVECFNGHIIPQMIEDKDQNGYKGDCVGWNFVNDNNRVEDLDGHGTHVTGIIHSVTEGAQGNIKILPLRVFAPDEGRRSVQSSAPLPTRLLKAFEYAIARKVDVIHMSVGWPKSFMTYELEMVIQKALDAGIIIVSAAGNSSQRATIWPCQIEGVICVGALRANGEIARFSNWGSQVDIMAPGEQILSTIPQNVTPIHISRKGYDYKNGTSQAAPFISAALALLKGVYPDESRDHLYARLMKSADQGKKEGALKGLFHLDRAMNIQIDSFVFPVLKGLHSVVADSNDFSLELLLKNYGKSVSLPLKVELGCEGATFPIASLALQALEADALKKIKFDGNLTNGNQNLECELKVNEDITPLTVKVLKKIPTPSFSVNVTQPDIYVVATRTGARSRFMTLDVLKGTTPGPLYYVAGLKDLTLYHREKSLGSVKLKEGCQFLRAWQVDYDRNGSNEVMIESMCEKSYLQYQFMDLSYKELYPAVKFKPTLTIINYEDFEIKVQKDAPPIFRFTNVGLPIPSESPWDSQVVSKANHLYELRPKQKEGEWNFEVAILEDPNMWVQSLGLRYLPSYTVYHFVENDLLIEIGGKTAWIDIPTQKARWAKLDNVLLMGSKRRPLFGTDGFLLQSFLTPYEYRGFLFSGVKLRYQQTNRFDPLLDILGTIKNEKGYLSILRSFQDLIYLQFDFHGNILSKNEMVVDRFDFLTAQDLISSVINLPYEGRMIQVVDGSKINTNYIDVISEKGKTSFEIPKQCVTQQPIVNEGKLTLPIFCAKKKFEFEMQFIEL